VNAKYGEMPRPGQFSSDDVSGRKSGERTTAEMSIRNFMAILPLWAICSRVRQSTRQLTVSRSIAARRRRRSGILRPSACAYFAHNRDRSVWALACVVAGRRGLEPQTGRWCELEIVFRSRRLESRIPAQSTSYLH